MHQHTFTANSRGDGHLHFAGLDFIAHNQDSIELWQRAARLGNCQICDAVLTMEVQLSPRDQRCLEERDPSISDIDLSHDSACMASVPAAALSWAQRPQNLVCCTRCAVSTAPCSLVPGVVHIERRAIRHESRSILIRLQPDACICWPIPAAAIDSRSGRPLKDKEVLQPV